MCPVRAWGTVKYTNYKGFSSVVKHLPSICKVLGCITRTEKKSVRERVLNCLAHPRPTESETLGVEASNLCLSSPPGDYTK